MLKKYLEALEFGMTWNAPLLGKSEVVQAASGRPFKHPVSALVVVDKKQGAEKAFRNFTGVKVVDVPSLNVGDLAPGTHPGRLTIWTQSALKGLGTRLGGT